MVAQRLPEDEPFFREWRARQPGERRSLSRAAQVGRLLGLSDLSRVPVLTVVGSKGKGTAVAHATSLLAAAGLTVGSITSPPFRTNRERVRLDGKELESSEYAALSALLAGALSDLQAPEGGYLSPTGAYTIAGAAWLVQSGHAEVLVLEEGLGGSSDEVSLFWPEVVAVTPIFEEHVGILGASTRDIAEDLLGVIRQSTRHVVTCRQDQVVEDLLGAKGGVTIETIRDANVSYHLVPGLGALNATVGGAAGRRMARVLGKEVQEDVVNAAAARVNLPGRLSVHEPAHGRRGTWVIDAAISPGGVAAALHWCQTECGSPELVLGSFPDIKDAAGCFAALAGLRVWPVTAGEDHLRFAEVDRLGALESAAAAMAAADSVDGVVLCIGTISFVAEALDHVEAPTSAWWPPAPLKATETLP